MNSMDIHFLRDARRSFAPARALDGAFGGEPCPGAQHLRPGRRASSPCPTRSATCSPTSSGRRVFTLPLAEDVPASPVPLAERRGMCFVGNFRHLPNREAVEYLCNDVLPLARPALLERHPSRCSATGSTRSGSTSTRRTPASSCGLGAVGPALPGAGSARRGPAAARRRRQAQGHPVDDGLHAGRHHPDRGRGPRPRPGRARADRRGRRRPGGWHHPPAHRRRAVGAAGPPGRRARRRPPPARPRRAPLQRDRRAGDGRPGPAAAAGRAAATGDARATVAGRTDPDDRGAGRRRAGAGTATGPCRPPPAACWPFPQARDGVAGLRAGRRRRRRHPPGGPAAAGCPLLRPAELGVALARTATRSCSTTSRRATGGCTRTSTSRSTTSTAATRTGSRPHRRPTCTCSARTRPDGPAPRPRCWRGWTAPGPHGRPALAVERGAAPGRSPATRRRRLRRARRRRRPARALPRDLVATQRGAAGRPAAAGPPRRPGRRAADHRAAPAARWRGRSAAVTPLPVLSVRQGRRAAGPVALSDNVTIGLRAPLPPAPAGEATYVHRVWVRDDRGGVAAVDRPPPEGTPRISVLIATYDRPELLRACLASFAKQTLDRADYEVVVVDDGSRDRRAARRRRRARRPAPGRRRRGSATRAGARPRTMAVLLARAPDRAVLRRRRPGRARLPRAPPRGPRRASRRGGGGPRPHRLGARARAHAAHALHHRRGPADVRLRAARRRPGARLARVLGGPHLVQAVAAAAPRAPRPAARLLDRRGDGLAARATGLRVVYDASAGA